MKHYSPTGRRNHGRPSKRLLDTWDRNGSTSGPTPWQIYVDDDGGLLGTGQVSSVFCKTVCRWVTTNCRFVSNKAFFPRPMFTRFDKRSTQLWAEIFLRM
jgi:hypothetical protein